ncbi:anion permease, partial [Shigella flexneri]
STLKSPSYTKSVSWQHYPVLTILTFLVHITLGVWWWNMLIGWNML